MISILEQSHHRARALLTCGAPVYLSANPVEYHGPHLSLRNDALISLGFIRSLHARLASSNPDWPLLFAGNLEAGVDPVPGPGSVFVSYRDMRRMVLDACRSLVELGAKRVVIMTFHGSPLHNLAIHKGIEFLENAGVQAVAPLAIVLRDLLQADPNELASAYAHVRDPQERAAMIQGAPIDIHGGFIETSLALHFAPESVSNHTVLPPCPETRPIAAFESLSRFFLRLGRKQLSDELRMLAAVAPWYGLRPFPGYTGRPHHATPEAGALFAQREVALMAQWSEQIFSGRARAPRPIMTWVEAFTLRGRIGEVRIPASEIAQSALQEPGSTRAISG